MNAFKWYVNLWILKARYVAREQEAMYYIHWKFWMSIRNMSGGLTFKGVV